MDKIKKGANTVMFFSDNQHAIEIFSDLVKKRNPRNEFIILEKVGDILGHLCNPLLPNPDIIIIDIQLENLMVLNLINQIKSSVHRYIPMILIKRDNDEKNILQFYSSYVNCFIMKPDESGKIVDILKSIDEFWLGVVNLPKFQVI